MSSARDIRRLNAVLSKSLAGFKPPENLTVSEWADKKRRLSSESSAEYGLWRTSRTPYLKEPMDAFTDPKVKHIVIVAASQVGKSETINNIIGYIIDQDPSSILFIHPTTIDAKEYSKLRIAPMIRDCKCLKSKVSDPKSRDSGNTILQKTYPGGILTMCGSTEAHALASKPIRYIIGDERDRWAISAGDEGDPWKLASARQITFFNAKSIEVSTPTIKGSSVIADAYDLGTQERWKTRCPHCGEYNEIVFDNIRFDKIEVGNGEKTIYQATNIYYICPSCGGISTEAEMKKQPARWEADNPDAYKANNTRSFWLSAWISPWATWASTINEYLEALGNSLKMQVVYNTRFGMLWENRGDIEDEDSIMARREDYGAELPSGVLMLTLGVDTQDDRFEYEVVGHGHFEETWSIMRGVIPGRPDDEETWEELDKIIDRIFKFKNGIGLPISATFIDEGGHFTHEVRLHCYQRQSKKVFAIKGRGGSGVPYISPPKKQKIIYQGKVIASCFVFVIGVNAGKEKIMDNLRVQLPGKNYCHFPKNDDYNKIYFNGLLSEHLVYKKGLKNPWVWEPIPGHKRNEPLDCRNYAIAAAEAVHPDYDGIERKLNDRIEMTIKSINPSKVADSSPKKKVQRPKCSKNKQLYNDNDW